MVDLTPSLAGLVCPSLVSNCVPVCKIIVLAYRRLALIVSVYRCNSCLSFVASFLFCFTSVSFSSFFSSFSYKNAILGYFTWRTTTYFWKTYCLLRRKKYCVVRHLRKTKFFPNKYCVVRSSHNAIFFQRTIVLCNITFLKNNVALCDGGTTQYFGKKLCFTKMSHNAIFFKKILWCAIQTA